MRKMFSKVRVIAHRVTDYWYHHFTGNGFIHIRGWQTSVKAQIVHISGFSGWFISVAITQVCFYSLKTAQGSKKKKKNGVAELQWNFNYGSFETEIWNTYNFHLPQNIILLSILFYHWKVWKPFLAQKHPRSGCKPDPAPRGKFADPCMNTLNYPIGQALQLI